MHDYTSEVRSLLTYNGEPRGWVLILQSLDGYTGGTNWDVVNAANAGLGVLVRLHWGYGTAGTLPPVAQYPTFASRAATFIGTHINSCKFYHIGNEPNFCAEWPAGGLADGRCDPNCTSIREQITAARYIDCFQRVYNALSPLLRAEAKLLVAPTGTWAGEFTCAGSGFETFDYVCYARTIYAGIPSHMIGGFALHPKTHNYELWQITSNALSGTPAFGCSHNEYVHWYFRVYQDMMDDIPPALRHLPVFFTELNPHEGGWLDTNIGYVQAAYDEINAWNLAHPDRLITAMMLYRWDDGNDIWDIYSRNQVKADLVAAVAKGQVSNGCAVATTPTATPRPTSTPTPAATHTPTPRAAGWRAY